MTFLAQIIFWALRLYSFVLVARIILDWVRAYNYTWRPRGALMAVAGVLYLLTDWPIKLVRRIIPPLRLGSIAIDLGVIIIFVLIGWLQNLALIFLR